MPRATARIAAAARDPRGTALIEFALVLPVMLIMYFGAIKIQDGYSRSRKVTVATRALADLASQSVSGSTTTAELDDVLAASAQVLAPAPASSTSFRISQIETDAAHQATVSWSRGRNLAARAKGSAVDMPTALAVPGTYYLLAEVTYRYKPPISYGVEVEIPLSDRIFMIPRNTLKIDCSGC